MALALVGCADGWVYALRADNGEQVYRLRIAPAERRIMAYGQIESAWPVSGRVSWSLMIWHTPLPATPLKLTVVSM